MKVSLLQLCVALAAACFAYGEEAAETQQRTSFFKKLMSPVTSVYKKSKQGLGSVKSLLTPDRKRAIKIEGEAEKLPEDPEAVLNAMRDEAAKNAEATARLAAKEAKDAADESTASAEETVLASEDTLLVAGDAAEEAVTASLKDAPADIDAVDEGTEGLQQKVKGSATEAQADVEEVVAEGTEEINAASESRSEEL